MLIRGLFSQWLEVSRASDLPVPCGHRLSYCLSFSTQIPNGMVRYAAPNISPNVFWSVAYRLARASMIAQTR